MKTSENGIAMIKREEGFSPRLYNDTGHPCIGYGCDLSPNEAQAYLGKTITEAEADTLLRSRVSPIESAINSHVTDELTQNQFDALVNFSYNVGIHAFTSSTLLRKLNAGDLPGAADEFLRWDRVRGGISEALLERRKQERALFIADQRPDAPPTLTA